MAIFENVPYGDINNLNLDGIIRAYMSVKGLPEDFQELKDYVMNYFENLDVTEELHEIIQEMIESGDFDQAIRDAIDEITEHNKYSTKKVALTVGHDGCQYTSINSAIADARIIIQQNPGYRVCISVSAGTYFESINLLANPGIDIVGDGSNVTMVRSADAYPFSPLYTTGTGYFEGITFMSTSTVNPTYGMHWENGSQGADVSGTAKFVNCVFSASNASAVGCGMGSGAKIEFHDCYFSSPSTIHSCYFHNRTQQQAQPGVIKLYNCTFNGLGPMRVDDAFVSAGQSAGSAILQVFSFNCHDWAGGSHGVTIIPDTNHMDQRYGYWSVSPNLQHYGRGNSIVALNSGEDSFSEAMYIPTATPTYFTFPLPNAKEYDITFNDVRPNGSADNYASSTTVLAANKDYCFCRCIGAPSGTTWYNLNVTARAKVG